MSNIFDSIVKEENSLSDLLYNCLKYDEFRNVFLEFLGITTTCAHDDFEREYYLGENGRCDLVVENSELLNLIEIKVYDTGLTDNQPHNYIKYIEDYDSNKKKQLHFLLPKKYSHISVLIEAQQQGKLQIVYWEDLLTLIPETNEVLKEFKSFLKSWFYMSLRTINDTELTLLTDKNFSTAISKLMDNIEELAKHLSQNYNVRKAKTSYEFGFYIDSKQYGEMFYGIWYEVWEKYNLPVVLCSGKENFKNDFSTNIKMKGWYITGVDITQLSDQEQILETVEKYL